MHKTKITIFLATISLALFGMAGVASAAPGVSNVSGTLTNGSPITISGLGFGATGPTIQIFDDFETGTNGSNIKIGASSATIGGWGSLSSNSPKYDNRYRVSGNMTGTPNFRHISLQD